MVLKRVSIPQGREEDKGRKRRDPHAKKVVITQCPFSSSIVRHQSTKSVHANGVSLAYLLSTNNARLLYQLPNP